MSSLSEKDARRISAFYNDALDLYGDTDARSVRWTSEKDQRKRNEILLSVGDLNGAAVLEVGSGLGALYELMLARKIQARYTGIDIISRFVDAARKKFPEADFRTLDVFELSGTFDYVLSSGALSFKVEDNERHYFLMIEKMYSLARRALAFNMLDRDHHSDNETYAAYGKDRVVAYCETLSKRVTLVEGYSPHDFTIIMRR